MSECAQCSSLRRERDISRKRTGIIRNLVLLVFFCSLVSVVVLAFAAPHAVPADIRYWLIGGGGFSFVVAIVAAILTRRDETLTLAFAFLCASLASGVLGIAIGSLRRI